MDTMRSWGRSLARQVLTCGPIPKHIAIIMDGNRRYAVKKNLAKQEGHAFGFNALKETLNWCLELGITTVTVYAFSIENFKRPKAEVDTIMNLAKDNLIKLIEEDAIITRHGVSVRAIGNTSLLPEDVQQVIATAVQKTAHHTKTILNVCVAYTSREEITHATQQLAHAVEDGHLRYSDVTDELFCSLMYMSDMPDIVLRTSGEVRLSDFLLWQGSFSTVVFLKVLWPEFSAWHLYYTVLIYQRNYQTIQERKEYYAEQCKKHQQVLDELFHQRCLQERRLAGDGTDSGYMIEDFRKDRKARIDKLYALFRTVPPNI